MLRFCIEPLLNRGYLKNLYYKKAFHIVYIHSAKGLEFKVVFICGLEEGLFPHQNSLDELQVEERRLCYVGITRARNHLHLSHSETRYRYGTRDVCKPSIFLKEIPKELVKLNY